MRDKTLGMRDVGKMSDAENRIVCTCDCDKRKYRRRCRDDCRERYSYTSSTDHDFLHASPFGQRKENADVA
jgi:hypothetical protein